jgi:hypothetical protein
MKRLNHLTNSFDSENTIKLWTPFIIFFLIHQTEEVLFSVKTWRRTVVLPPWASFTDRSPVYAVDSQGQTALLLVVGPCVALLTLAYLLRKNSLATKLAISTLLSVLMLAFIMHIAVSLSTHSLMPGVYTSIFPGLPIGGYLFGWVWRKPSRTGSCRQRSIIGKYDFGNFQKSKPLKRKLR